MSGTQKPIQFITTPKQARAWKLLNGRAQAILLDGGARSGKSRVILMAQINMAQQFAGSRHLIARWRLAHAKSSIWHESLIPILETPGSGWTVHRGDLYASYYNGSEIWLGGFDDQDRIEKILGHEYLTCYCNEVSQISYEAFCMARSRLAQHIEGAENKIFCDCNPPSPMHWAHKLFLERKEPRSGEVVDKPELYARLQMNPIDNAKNLPPNYISDVLGSLPDRERNRFIEGIWLSPEGLIMYKFHEGLIFEDDKIPPLDQFEDFVLGVDFGLNPAAVLGGIMGDHVWLLDDWSAYNITASAMNAELEHRWKDTPWSVAYCDPSGGEHIQEIKAGSLADNAVEDGLDTMNAKMERGELHVSRRCAGWLGEVYDYRRDEQGRIIKTNDHFQDAARYLAHSVMGKGVVLYV